MKRTLIALAIAAMLTGCGSLPSGTFANRISCTLDHKQAFVNSMYGVIGITSKVHADDAAVACAVPVAAAASK